MNDLNVQVEQKPGKIICNFAEIKEALKVQMTAYTTLEITEEGQKVAKSDLATLRKIRKAVDDQRKAVKNEFMVPYNEFENQVKDILSVIDEPIKMIDLKLKEFDEKRIEEKQKHIHELYEECVGEYLDYIPYSLVASPKWSNATCKDSEIKFEISEAVLKVKTDLETIRMLNSEIEEELFNTYKNAGNNLQAAIQKNNDYSQAKKLAEEKLKEVKEENTIDEPKEEKVDDTKSNNITFVDIHEENSNKDTVNFRITGTDNIQAVRDFLFLSQIEYMEV